MADVSGTHLIPEQIGGLYEAIFEHTREENSILESFCLRSLSDRQGRGVLHVRNADDPWQYAIELSAEVPQGTIHYYADGKDGYTFPERTLA